MEIMEAAQWVAVSSLVQKGLRTKTQFCDVDNVCVCVGGEIQCGKEELYIWLKDLNSICSHFLLEDQGIGRT